LQISQDQLQEYAKIGIPTLKNLYDIDMIFVTQFKVKLLITLNTLSHIL